MIRKISKRRSAAGEVYSIKRSPIKKRNPKRIAKRKVAFRKMLAGKEYKAARAEAMERSGKQCEFSTRIGYPGGVGNFVHRCPHTLELHAHHLRYPKVRPLEATDLLIVCEYHHEYLESLKPHKQRMF